MIISELNDLISEVCPIDGCNSNGVIWFKEEATQEQKDQAQALMDQYISCIDNGCSISAQSTPSSAKILCDVLVTKGVLTQEEIDAEATENGVVFFDK